MQAGDRFKQLARQQADLQAGIDACGSGFQAINGRMEELVQRENQLDQKLSLLQKDLGMKVSAPRGAGGKAGESTGAQVGGPTPGARGIPPRSVRAGDWT